MAETSETTIRNNPFHTEPDHYTLPAGKAFCGCLVGDESSGGTQEDCASYQSQLHGTGLCSGFQACLLLTGSC